MMFEPIVFYSLEDNGFIAALPEFAGLSAFGITEDAALKELKIAEKGFLEVIIEDKGEVK